MEHTRKHTQMARLNSKMVCLLMKEKDLTVEKLAGNIKCSGRQVRKWRRQDTDIHVSNLFLLAAELEVSADELVVYSPIPYEKE